MKKIRLLLLDANIIIKLFVLGLWEPFLERCEVLISRVVLELEAKRYDAGSEERLIDLAPYGSDGRITVVDVDSAQLRNFISMFDAMYLDRLDPGESESLAYLHGSPDRCLICSADSIVFKTLGLLNRSDQGLSLDEALQSIGLGRSLEWQYSRAFRLKYTQEGEQDRIQDRGLC